MAQFYSQFKRLRADELVVRLPPNKITRRTRILSPLIVYVRLFRGSELMCWSWLVNKLERWRLVIERSQKILRMNQAVFRHASHWD